MKYYIIAGEASGDLHGSNLFKEIKQLDLNAEFRCWGGDLMKSQGAEIVRHINELAFMGFAEVLLNIRTILGNISFCKKDILNYKPDVLVLIDYPGFNLRIAEFAKKNGFKVIYYISPQLWAWKQSRVKIIKKYVDRMIVILPFEKDFYTKHNFNADFVGHPLLDAIENNVYADKILTQKESKPIIAILPGSRKQEVKKMLPVMAKISNNFPDYRFIIAGVSSLDQNYYKKLIGNRNIEIAYSATYELLSKAKAALVTSGTATLETALFEVPEVVCYKGNYISYRIARSVIKIKYISLVNLIMDQEIVKELIQQDFNEEQLILELKKILDPINSKKLKESFITLKSKLGGKGASFKAAEIIVIEAKSNPL